MNKIQLKTILGKNYFLLRLADNHFNVLSKYGEKEMGLHPFYNLLSLWILDCCF